MLLVEVGGAVEQLRPRLAAKRVPADLRGVTGAGHPVDLGGSRLEHGSDRDAVVLRRHDRPALTLSKARLGRPAAALECLQPLEQRLANQRIGQVDARAVAAVGAEHIARKDDLRIALGLKRVELGDGVPDQLVERDLLVGDAVDEAGIGAVLEQPSNEIGEQLLVAADRRVDPHRRPRIADAVLELGQFIVKRLAHAVKALKLEWLATGESAFTCPIVFALWVANAGKMASLAANSFFAQAR